MCKNQYESRRRIKTKAYNYNYFLAYNLGVKVKHQYKGWTGLWRKENADEIRLGVIGATFFYDYSSYFTATPSTNRITTIYNNNNRWQYDANTFWSTNYLNPLAASNMTGFSTQNYPRLFRDNYYIEDVVPFLHTNNILDSGVYAAIQAGNKQLTYNNFDKLFWQGVMGKIQQWANNSNQGTPDNNITYSYNAPPLGKLLVKKTFYEAYYNKDDIQRTFDWGFQVGFNIGSDGSISPSTSPSSLKRPTELKVLMYGLVKRNGQWHGVKMNTSPIL